MHFNQCLLHFTQLLQKADFCTSTGCKCKITTLKADCSAGRAAVSSRLAVKITDPHVHGLNSTINIFLQKKPSYKLAFAVQAASAASMHTSALCAHKALISVWSTRLLQTQHFVDVSMPMCKAAPNTAVQKCCSTYIPNIVCLNGCCKHIQPFRV